MALREHIEASTLLLNDSQLPYMKFDDFSFHKNISFYVSMMTIKPTVLNAVC